jgi:hypothetical protein
MNIPLEKGDTLSTEAVDFIEKIQTEDRTDFETAMRGYDMLVDLVLDQWAEAKRHNDANFDAQELAKRVLASREILGVRLGKAVRLFMTEGEDLPAPQKKCSYSGCQAKVADGSYYFCREHRPEESPDDGDLTYHQTLPGDLGNFKRKLDAKYKELFPADTEADDICELEI